VLKSIVRSVTPPILYELAHMAKGTFSHSSSHPVATKPSIVYGCSGDYASYEEATRECPGGYEQESIISVTIKNTKAARDARGTALDLLSLRFLAGVQYAAAKATANPIRVLDFGGAMGAHYFKLRRFLPHRIQWTVIELPATVRAARAEFSSHELKFEEDIEVAGQADIVLASGALQYTSDPYENIKRLIETGAKGFVFDKVPLLVRDRITVQRVDPSLFDASFTCWIMAKDRFLEETSGLEMRMSWEMPDYASWIDGTAEHINHGFVFERA
jgi:putative methyltransferase (TIGR04325 family)